MSSAVGGQRGMCFCSDGKAAQTKRGPPRPAPHLEQKQDLGLHAAVARFVVKHAVHQLAVAQVARLGVLQVPAAEGPGQHATGMRANTGPPDKSKHDARPVQARPVRWGRERACATARWSLT